MTLEHDFGNLSGKLWWVLFCKLGQRHPMTLNDGLTGNLTMNMKPWAQTLMQVSMQIL
jgi:hypothetical protein